MRTRMTTVDVTSAEDETYVTDEQEVFECRL